MCEPGDSWRRIIRQVLDKDRWERHRRVCFEHDNDTKSESTENVQSAVVKKTVRFKKFHSVIRGDMGLSDRKRRTNYSRVDTMFYRCRNGYQSLQGHAVHEGIMELNPVELTIYYMEQACARTAALDTGDGSRMAHYYHIGNWISLGDITGFRPVTAQDGS